MSHPEGDKEPLEGEEASTTAEAASAPRERLVSDAGPEIEVAPLLAASGSIPARRSSRPPPRPDPGSSRLRRASEAPPVEGHDEPVLSGPRPRSAPPSQEDESSPALVPIQVMRVIAIGREDDAPELTFHEREIGDEDIGDEDIQEEAGADELAAALHAAGLEAPRPEVAVDETDAAISDREPNLEEAIAGVPAPAPADPAEAMDSSPGLEAPAPQLGATGADEDVEALDDVEVALEVDRPAVDRSNADRPSPDRPSPPKPPAKSAPPRIGARSQLPQPPATRRRPWWEHLFGDDFARAYRPLTESQVQKQVDFIEKSLGLQAGAVLLDLCCGQGQQAVELAARGYGVVGYDLSVFQLALAAENAQARHLKINFLQGDAREMAFDQMFDGLLCWDTSFGYFEEEKNHNVAERMFKALRPGGVLLLDMLNRDFAAVESPNHVWFEGDGCICMDDVSLDWITSRLRVKRSLILDDGRSRELTYSLRLYSLHELGKLLHDVGFRVTQASGDLTTPGVFLGPNSPRIIIRAQKPGG